jgi:hypothetical protein
LRFTRSEFRRALEGLTEEDAQRRLMPMNCIFRAQGQVLLPHLNEMFAYGAPACVPTLREAWDAWNTITQAADPWLDAVTTATLLEPVMANGKPLGTNFGNLLQRVIYHYWYHTGESVAVRQMLGHTGLPDFVGNIDGEAPYTPE